MGEGYSARGLAEGDRLNTGQKKTFAATLGFTVFLVAAPGMSSALRDGATGRREFASLYSNDGVQFSTAGISDDVLLVEKFPADTATCSANLDVIAADGPFVDRLTELGFHAVECWAYDTNDHIVGSEIRKIVPRAKPVPFKSVSNSGDAIA
jgi:hypothetical protein